MSTNVKKDNPTTSMPFAITAKDHTIAIASKVSLVMDSIAPVGNKKESNNAC